MKHVLAIVVALGGVAHAEPGDEHTSSSESVMASPGLMIGTAIGAELSVFEVHEIERDGGLAGDWPTPRNYPLWYGGYVDGGYDRNRKETRVTLGPEIGTKCVGIDGGLVVAQRNGQLEAGFAIRPVVAFGVFDVFARYELVGGDNVFEGGVLIKAPFHIHHRDPSDDGPRRYRAAPSAPSGGRL
jgi:hypothetical protein